ncbi:MAG: GGDEF domain-containing protein [Robiginitomaculum sp.]|nr:MAG: GGDEF domain-containing protein [Robiginitomaculum sp.]
MHSSLAFKAFLLIGMAALVASFVVVFLSARLEQSDRQAYAQAQGLALANASAAALTPALFSNDSDVVEQTLKRLSDQNGVLRLRVMDPTGLVIFPANRRNTADRGTDFSRAIHAGKTSIRVENNTLYSAVPLFENGRLRAVVGHSYDLSLNQAGFWALVVRNIWRGLILLGVAVPAGLLVFIRLLSPLGALNKAAEQAAAGDLSVRLDVTRCDELGRLSSNFNTMLDRLKSNFDRTRWLAYGDSLTRLSNKTAFNERLRKLVRLERPPGALLLIDLDGFKRFNDAYGQDEGDRILTIIAQRLRKIINAHAPKFAAASGNIRPLLSRLSGNEFAMLIPGARSAPEIQNLANAILTDIAAPIDLSGHSASLSARIGIALYPHDAGDARNLLTSVNFAIDEAKKNGGGTWCFFEPSMSQKAIRRMTLHNELRQAMRENEFIVHYQPKIDVREGTIAGCEALVRWQQSSGKLVGPGDFIEAAEESGLICEIGDFVLEESCLAAARWAKEGYDCGVAVNVSALQFASNDFTQVVFRALDKAGLPPSKLELELTESVAMTNPERMLEQIGPLREKGVRFAIDDFGTGHSSLAYLTRLPFDVFKIDKSFVQSMTEDKHARVIVQTVLAMAESLGYRTVAEGVETREHFAFLQLHCCDYVQGYYFAKPMFEADLVSMLAAEKASLARDDIEAFAKAV